MNKKIEIIENIIQLNVECINCGKEIILRKGKEFILLKTLNKYYFLDKRKCLDGFLIIRKKRIEEFRQNDLQSNFEIWVIKCTVIAYPIKSDFFEGFTIIKREAYKDIKDYIIENFG